MESVFAIIIAAGAGYWLDSRFETSPRWLVVGAIVGFAAFVLRLARMAKLIEDPAEKTGQSNGEPESGESKRQEEDRRE